MRQAVDFFHIPSEQTEIHARLVNWARWASPGHRGSVHPMFRGYRPYLYPEPASSSPINTLDAAQVQKIMCRVPERHRIAVQWYYIINGSPARICRAMGVNPAGLAQMVVEARTMVRNLLPAEASRSGLVSQVVSAS